MHRRSPIAIASAFGLLVTSYGLMLIPYLTSYLDDPFIAFRYARHLAGGMGAVWNLGEQPVEGYTSTLWMLIAAGFEYSRIHPFLGTKCIGILSMVVALWTVVSGYREVIPQLSDRVFLGLLFVISQDVAFYSASGMENILFIPLVLVYWRIILRSEETDSRRVPAVHLAVVGSLLCWVRPEGHFFLVLGLWYAWSRGRTLGTWRTETAQYLVVCAALVASLHIARYLYYGDVLPNTYYAKHSGGTLTDSALSGILYTGYAFPAYTPFVMLSVLYLLREDHRTWPKIMLATIPAWFLYVLKVGGDDGSAFPYARLFLPMIPSIFLASVLAIRKLTAGTLARTATLTSLILLFGSSQFGTFVNSVRHAFGFTNMSSHHARTVASRVTEFYHRFSEGKIDPSGLSSFLKSHTPESEFIAIPWVGRIAYETDLPVIDLLGLNDQHIAHTRKRERGTDVKYDPDYILQRMPFYICENFSLSHFTMAEISQMTQSDYYRHGAWRTGQRALLGHPALHANYEVEAGLPDVGDITCFKRKSVSQ